MEEMVLQNIWFHHAAIKHYFKKYNIITTHRKWSSPESSPSLPSSAPWPHSPSQEADSPPRYGVSWLVSMDSCNINLKLQLMFLTIVSPDYSPASRWPTSSRLPSLPDHSRPSLVSETEVKFINTEKVWERLGLSFNCNVRNCNWTNDTRRGQRSLTSILISWTIAAVTACGLADTLSGKGPLTVFAPTDAAFAKLPAGTVEGKYEVQLSETKITCGLSFHRNLWRGRYHN